MPWILIMLYAGKCAQAMGELYVHISFHEILDIFMTSNYYGSLFSSKCDISMDSSNRNKDTLFTS